MLTEVFVLAFCSLLFQMFAFQAANCAAFVHNPRDINKLRHVDKIVDACSSLIGSHRSCLSGVGVTR